MDAHHSQSRLNKRPRVSFDIDSICCFPTSLGVARLGIQWYPKQYQPLSLKGSVHLGLKTLAYRGDGRLATEFRPLHQVRHYCFGHLVGASGVLIYIFFPNMIYEGGGSGSGGGEHRNTGARKKTNATRTMLKDEDEVLWIDSILLPAIYAVVQDSNILQHYPSSAAVIQADARASGSESYAKEQHSREQFINYFLQPQHLDAIWEEIRRRTQSSARYFKFTEPVLFLNAKNTKSEHMTPGLSAACAAWRRQ